MLRDTENAAIAKEKRVKSLIKKEKIFPKSRFCNYMSTKYFIEQSG